MALIECCPGRRTTATDPGSGGSAGDRSTFRSGGVDSRRITGHRGSLGCREGGGNPTSVGAVETHQMRRDRRRYEVDIEGRPGLPGCVMPIPRAVGVCSSAPFRPVGWPHLA
jgi:hypothetical protein